MHIGVTGGAGYIGSHVVRDLLDAGHTVTVLDDMSSGNQANIFTDIPGFSFIQGSTLCQNKVDLLLEEQPKAIFHFADLKSAPDSMTYPEKYSQNNIRGTLNLIEAMARHDCRYFIYSSSAAVYGAPSYIPIDENHSLNPINYYGFTKLAIEENLRWYSQLKGLFFATLRYFNAAGHDIAGRFRSIELSPHNLIPMVMEVASKRRKRLMVFGCDYNTPDGTCIRDYIHINDLSCAHLSAMEFIIEMNENLTINLGTQKGHSVMEIIESTYRITGKKIEYTKAARRRGDPDILIADNRKGQELLGWEARHSDLETLIESSWKVYSQAELSLGRAEKR